MKHADADDAESRESKKATLGESSLTLVKGMVGSGVLFLPKAYEQGGLIAANVSMVVIGAMCLYSVHLLLEVREFALPGSPLFGDLAELMLGKAGRRAVDVSSVLSQLGFCCCYLIFVSDNLRQSAMLLSECETRLPAWAVILGQGLIYIPLSWVRRINHFGVTSAFSNILTAAGLLYIFSVTETMQMSQTTPTVVRNVNWATFPTFIGTGVYSFAGIGLVVPIYNRCTPTAFPFSEGAPLSTRAPPRSLLTFNSPRSLSSLAHPPVRLPARPWCPAVCEPTCALSS